LAPSQRGDGGPDEQSNGRLSEAGCKTRWPLLAVAVHQIHQPPGLGVEADVGVNVRVADAGMVPDGVGRKIRLGTGKRSDGYRPAADWPRSMVAEIARHWGA
jgi:hypothetical protein